MKRRPFVFLIDDNHLALFQFMIPTLVLFRQHYFKFIRISFRPEHVIRICYICIKMLRENVIRIDLIYQNQRPLDMHIMDSR